MLSTLLALAFLVLLNPVVSYNVLSTQPLIVHFAELLTPMECMYLITTARATGRMGPAVDYHRDARHSNAVFLNEAEMMVEALVRIRGKMLRAVQEGANTSATPTVDVTQAEALQVQHYASRGNHYKAHHDSNLQHAVCVLRHYWCISTPPQWGVVRHSRSLAPHQGIPPMW